MKAEKILVSLCLTALSCFLVFALTRKQAAPQAPPGPVIVPVPAPAPQAPVPRRPWWKPKPWPGEESQPE